MGQWPIVVVHKADESLRSEFLELRQRGCTVLEAPSFRLHRKGLYPPRNELGSLLTISSMHSLDQPILFCEPDMLFVDKIEYKDVLTGEYYGYLNYDSEHIAGVARHLLIEHLLPCLNRYGKIGVPYLIPAQFLHRIASRWLETLDAFEELQWIDIMYAFGLCLALEGLEAETSHIMNDNFRPSGQLSRRLVHYCYGDSVWNKRFFLDKGTPLGVPDELLPRTQPGSILHEMMCQLRQARAFYARGI